MDSNMKDYYNFLKDNIDKNDPYIKNHKLEYDKLFDFILKELNFYSHKYNLIPNKIIGKGHNSINFLVTNLNNKELVLKISNDELTNDQIQFNNHHPKALKYKTLGNNVYLSNYFKGKEPTYKEMFNIILDNINYKIKPWDDINNLKTFDKAIKEVANKKEYQFINNLINSISGTNIICHGDYHKENILINNNDYIIFDSYPVYCPAEYDLASLLWTFNNHEKDLLKLAKENNFNINNIWKFYLIRNYYYSLLCEKESERFNFLFQRVLYSASKLIIKKEVIYNLAIN